MVYPFINVVLVFLPISIPMGLILVEALSTANVLATSEALIHHGLGRDDSAEKNESNSDNGSQKSSSTIAGAVAGAGGAGGAGAGGGGKPSGKTKFFKKKYMNISGGMKSDSDDDDSSEDSDKDCLDEYQDEDIDDRCVLLQFYYIIENIFYW
jgi:hypothetical protein